VREVGLDPVGELGEERLDADALQERRERRRVHHHDHAQSSSRPSLPTRTGKGNGRRPAAAVRRLPPARPDAAVVDRTPSGGLTDLVATLEIRTNLVRKTTGTKC